MEDVRKRFGLDTKIMGKEPLEYISNLIERIQNQQVEIECAKAEIAGMKQFNNTVKNHIDATRVVLKEIELKTLAQKHGIEYE